MMSINRLNNHFLMFGITVLALIGFIFTFNYKVYAEENTYDVEGKIYEFDGKSNYKITSKTKYASTNETDKEYGTFSISGSIGDIGMYEGVPAYGVTENNIFINYSYTDTLLNAKVDKWHLVEDDGKTVNGIGLNSSIKKGAIIIQTSRDQKNWTNVNKGCKTNIFSKWPNRKKAFYKSTDVELTEGCFYRVIVAFEKCKRTKKQYFLMIDNSKYKYLKQAEVYQFYAYNLDAANEKNNDQTHELGQSVRCTANRGYAGDKKIKKYDPHYGWKLGQFYVSGFTAKQCDGGDPPLFLKNVNDKVTLWFRLKQDINKLDGNDKIRITADSKGYDEDFQVKEQNFEKGALIIQYTDYKNETTTIGPFINYLEANTTLNANTKVRLFEEGDYKVALDYQLQNDKLELFGQTINPETSHYRIYFEFKVRNGNCMAYPLDIKTKGELLNSSITEDGFYLDLARSRYLDIYIKKEILNATEDGLVEDIRFNRPANEGEVFTEEGIYTITVNNKYTNQQTIKKIYVGKNNILKASVKTDRPVKEIKEMIEQGATIDDNGMITPSAFASPIEEGDSSEGTTESADESNLVKRFFYNSFR